MRLVFALAAALLLAAALDAQTTPRDAWTLFRMRDYKAALEQFQKDSKQAPESAVLHDAIGWCHYFLGAYDEAEKRFKAALARDLAYKWSQQGLEAVAAARKAPLDEAYALFAAGRYLDARVLYQKIAAGETASPANTLADAHAGDGWCAYYLGRYDEAIKAFQRALKARSDLAAAARGIGYCKYALGDWSDALVALQLSFKSEPEHYEARLTAGWCHYRKNDFANAAKEFQRASTAVQGAWGAELGLAWCDFQQGKEHDAFAHFERAVSFSPSAFDAEVRALTDARREWWLLYRVAGWSALRARLDTTAKEYLTAARNLSANDVDALRGLAFAHFRLGEYDQALANADEVGSAEATLAPATFPTTLADGRVVEIAMNLELLRGWSFYRTGKYDQALARFRAVRAQHADWVDAICGEGWVLFAQGEITAAERAFNAARTLLPGYSDADTGKQAVDHHNSAEYLAAWQLYEAGDFARACAAFEALEAKTGASGADDREDKRPLIRASLGWAQARKGDGAAALRSFERATTDAPEIGLGFKGWGWLLMQRSQWAEAADKLERASKCRDLERDAETLAMLGWCAQRLDQLERALAAFERAKVLDPTSSYALGGLAAVQLALGRPVEARIELERAVRIDPTLEDAEWLAPKLNVEPELWKLYSPLGWAWYSRANYARAEADFRRASENDPLEPTAKRGLALTLLKLGKLDEGKERMGKFLATLPAKENPWGEAANILSEFGWALYAANDFAAAQKVFRQLAELHAGEQVQYADPWDGLGWCALRAGKHKDAREAFLKAIAIQPRYESSLKGLEALVTRE